jgi:hypothetical protein
MIQHELSRQRSVFLYFKLEKKRKGAYNNA